MIHPPLIRATATGPVRWWLAGARGLLHEARRHRYAFAIVGAIWMLALIRIFFQPTPFLPILFNWTPSLPYHVVYVDFASKAFARGDLVIYSFAGEAGRKDYPGLKNQPFFKRIIGVAGDRIAVVDRDVLLNGAYVGHAKTHTFDRRALDPIAAGPIPPGYFYVQGSSPDSFDSRYLSSGLVPAQQVLAKVHPLF